MPYRSNADLPQSVRSRLPEHAQDIYRAAFNNSWNRDGDRDSDRREEIAHRVAWSAVKKRYQRVDAAWVPRVDLDFPA